MDSDLATDTIAASPTRRRQAGAEGGTTPQGDARSVAAPEPCCCDSVEVDLGLIEVVEPTGHFIASLVADHVAVSWAGSGAGDWPAGAEFANGLKLDRGQSTDPGILMARVTPSRGCWVDLDLHVQVWKRSGDVRLALDTIDKAIAEVNAAASALASAKAAVPIAGLLAPTVTSAVQEAADHLAKAVSRLMGLLTQVFPDSVLMADVHLRLDGQLPCDPRLALTLFRHDRSDPNTTVAEIPGDADAFRITKTIEQTAGKWRVSFIVRRRCTVASPIGVGPKK